MTIWEANHRRTKKALYLLPLTAIISCLSNKESHNFILHYAPKLAALHFTNISNCVILQYYMDINMNLCLLKQKPDSFSSYDHWRGKKLKMKIRLKLYLSGLVQNIHFCEVIHNYFTLNRHVKTDRWHITILTLHFRHIYDIKYVFHARDSFIYFNICHK